MSTTTADNYGKRFDAIDMRFEETGKRFDRIDERLDRKFSQIDEQFDKLTAFMIKRFDRIEQALETKADKVDLHRALDALDTVMERQEICDQERLVIMHQLTRHDRWVHELADKVNHKLSPA